VIHLIEGDWMRGERLLTQGLKGSDSPLVSYLLAARAAQLQGAKDRRDEWLKLAAQESPAAETAALLTQAELQLDGGELDAALATAERLQTQKPDHPAVLALLARVYRARNDAPQLIARASHRPSVTRSPSRCSRPSSPRRRSPRNGSPRSGAASAASSSRARHCSRAARARSTAWV
jgi:hypothetical protein